MTEEVKQKAGPKWKIPADNLRRETWKRTLVSANGNITRAAQLARIARSHATRLTKRFDLITFAAELRIESGAKPASGEREGVVTGRPRGTKNSGRSL